MSVAGGPQLSTRGLMRVTSLAVCGPATPPEKSHVIGSLRSGDTPREISRHYKIPVAAVDEAIALSERYDYEESYA